MGTLTFDSDYQQLWGASSSKYRFYGEVQVTTSRSDANNTYTISVTGIKAHCGEWNFKTNYSITLGGSTATGTIPASGSNTYSGWMPKSGWYTGGLPLTVTVNGNSNGSCPAVNLYFKCYNGNVKWLSAGKYISVSSTYNTTNIASSVQSSSGGPNDVASPTISLSRTDVTSTSLSFSGSSNYWCTDWQYQLDGGAWTSCGWGNGYGSSKTITVSSANHTLQIWAKRTTNGKGGYSSSVGFDCRNPNITNTSAIATSSTSANVSFKSGYNCTYYIKNSAGTQLATGKCTGDSPVTKAITTPASDADYTIHLVRDYDASLTNSATVHCYSALPVINTFTMTPKTSTSATVTIKCNCKFNWRVKRPSGTYTSWSGDCNAATNITSDITVASTSGTYTVEVRRVVNNTLQASKTTTCNTVLPTLTLTRQDVTDSSLKFKCVSDVNCDEWQYRLDGGAWTSCGWSTGKGTKKTLSSLSQANHSLLLWARRTDNDLGGYSSTVYFDTRNPSISKATITATSTTSANVVLKTDYKCYFYITNSSGTQLASGTTDDNGNGSVKITTPAKDADYTILVKRTYDTSLTATKSVTCYSANPTIQTYTIAPKTATSATVTVKSNCKFNWRLLYGSTVVSDWSGDLSAGTLHTATVSNLASQQRSYKLEIRRVVNNVLKASKSESCDLRIPTINTYTLTPTDVNKATLKLTTSHDCEFTIATAVTPKPTGTTSSKSYSGTVTLDSNTKKDYSITVKRTDCTAIQNTGKALNVDTRKPKLGVNDNVTTIGATCTFTAVAKCGGSDCTCYDWYARIHYTEGDVAYSGWTKISTTDCSTVTYTFNNVLVNRDFEIEVKAKRRYNNALGTVTKATYKCLGIGHITSGGRVRVATAYIYTTHPKTKKKQWCVATPYVYTNGKWEVCV